MRHGIKIATIFNSQGAKVEPSSFMMDRLGEEEEEPDAKEFAKQFAEAIGAVPVPVKTE